jgi:hypothetical protein
VQAWLRTRFDAPDRIVVASAGFTARQTVSVGSLDKVDRPTALHATIGVGVRVAPRRNEATQ